MELAHIITERVAGVTATAKAALHEPLFEGNELTYVKDCIESGWVSSVGQYVDRFERDLAQYTGCARAVLVNNGTSGLQIALELVGVGHDDEVLVPALSFVATANAVRHCGAWPHFVDSEYATMGMCGPSLLAYLDEIAELRGESCINKRTGRRIAAIVPMHTFGHPVDMPAIMAVADRFRIPVVEDAAESLGSTLDGRHTGNFGRCAVLSFNGNKIVTTGGGGAIMTNDIDLATRAKHLTTTAKLPHRWAFYHDEVGYNFRMPNLNAALGCAQLERLESFIARKRQLTLRYQAAFDGVAGVRLFVERPQTRANYWLQTLTLDSDAAGQRDAILAATNDAHQMTRPVWELLSTLPMYRTCQSMETPVARDLSQRIINLPSSPQLVQGTR
ncbi:LegC family aminotransferase [Comamonadaceae bacterium G21597-S1]|nr:LegC family aminotransferase [Comamonadaceae bacterium G21597-S1]